MGSKKNIFLTKEKTTTAVSYREHTSVFNHENNVTFYKNYFQKFNLWLKINGLFRSE